MFVFVDVLGQFESPQNSATEVVSPSELDREVRALGSDLIMRLEHHHPPVESLTFTGT